MSKVSGEKKANEQVFVEWLHDLLMLLKGLEQFLKHPNSLRPRPSDCH